LAALATFEVHDNSRLSALAFENVRASPTRGHCRSRRSGIFVINPGRNQFVARPLRPIRFLRQDPTALRAGPVRAPCQGGAHRESDVRSEIVDGPCRPTSADRNGGSRTMRCFPYEMGFEENVGFGPEMPARAGGGPKSYEGRKVAMGLRHGGDAGFRPPLSAA